MHAQSQKQCCPSAILRPQGTYLRELFLLLQAQRGKFDHDLNQLCHPRETLSKLCVSGVRLQEHASCEEHNRLPLALLNRPALLPGSGVSACAEWCGQPHIC